MSTQPDQTGSHGGHHGHHHHHGHHGHSEEANQRDSAPGHVQRQPDSVAEAPRNDRQTDGDAETAGDQEWPAILVDAANVAFFNRDAPNAKASIDNLLAMHQQLERLGYRPIFIADAALKYKVDDQQRLDRLEQEGQILQAPAGTQSDYFLLALSTRENLPIVSNDVYRDRAAEFPEAVKRRVPFMIVEGDVLIERENLDRVEYSLRQARVAKSNES